MEVHHHAHTERKKWTHYLWEFLMLFLAVFCGFLAENQREHMIEHKKEKKLVTEMVEDLKKDSAFLGLCLNRIIPNHLKLLDSAIILLQKPGHERDRETYQAYLTATEWNFNYIPTDRTLSQFRSYGYRLIRNNLVADALGELEIMYKVYFSINDYVHNMQNDIDESANVFADKTIVDRLFITEYPFPNDVSIKLDEIPVSAHVNKTDPGFQNFITKLKKYSYYLATILKEEYIRLSKFQYSTINILKREYHLM
jgi:hypothetical protein